MGLILKLVTYYVVALICTIILIKLLFIKLKKLLPNSIYILLSSITMFIIYFIIYTIFFAPIVYADSFVNDMNNGVIARTPLLQPGQTILTLTHGLYPVTGGYVNIGFLGNGHVTKVIGIMVDNYPATLQG